MNSSRTMPRNVCLALAHATIVLGVVSTGVLCAGVRAQDARSTLPRLADESTVVAQVRVLDRYDAGATRAVVFKTVALLKGSAPATFTLTEPGGRACGDTLHGLAVNAGYLAFLSTTTTTVRLTVASARALLPLDPTTIAYTRALLTNATPGQRLALLTAGLGSPLDRIRTDAALTLPRSPLLQRLDARQRQQVIGALDHALGTDHRVAFGLLQVAQRLHLTSAVDVLVPRYLETQAGRLDAAVMATITALDSDRAVAWVAARLPDDMPRLRRAVELLKHCRSAAATHCLQRLSASESRPVAQLATTALLQQAMPQTVERDRFRSILQGPIR
jgi:hypothetical protein